MSDKREVLQTYLAGHNIPKEISEKISYTSISTPNFSYYAFRVGNSIGDVLELAMDFILAKTICEKNDLILYTVEHCEFHSKDITEGDLDRLVARPLDLSPCALEVEALGDLPRGLTQCVVDLLAINLAHDVEG